MSNSYNATEAAKVNTELILLREDAERVHTPSLRIQILNMIAQKETRLNLLKLKLIGHVTQALTTRPTSFWDTQGRRALHSNKKKEITGSQRR